MKNKFSSDIIIEIFTIFCYKAETFQVQRSLIKRANPFCMVSNERKRKTLMSNEGIMKKYVLDINECL